MAGTDLKITVDVRRASHGDVDAIVEIHKGAFKGFFLTQLGERFLNLYYSSVLDFDGGILLVAQGNELQPLGFAAGFTDSRGFYRLLKKRRLIIARTIAMPLLRSPRLIVRLFASASLADERCNESARSSSIELSSIAVAATCQGSGVGGRLLDAFCREARERAATSIVLTTDARDNDVVNNFYVGAGFEIRREFRTKAGRHMNEYILPLKQQATGAGTAE